MELSHIGQVCVICRRNDYLPFRCSHCKKIVCIDHKADHGQECPLDRTTFDADQSSNPALSLRAPCDFCKKITLELELVPCDKCNSRHCLYHRHYVQHECTKYGEDLEKAKREVEEKARRQREAVARVKETYKPQAQTTSVVGIAKTQILDPKKRELAKRLRVMRLKQFAKGPPNIAMEDRIYFEVKFLHQPESGLSSAAKDGKSVKMFTRKDCTIGRMVDWCAAELDITNKNNLSNADQLVFQTTTETGDRITLDNHSKFCDNMETKTMDNGDEIFLIYLKTS